MAGSGLCEGLPVNLCSFVIEMNLLVFNIVFYLVTLLSYEVAIKDSGASLGVGFFLLAFWLLSLIVLVVLLRRKLIIIRSFLDKIGLFTATPVPCLLAVLFLRNG